MSTPSSDSPKIDIVIIDDDPELLTLLTVLLKQNNFNVHQATNSLDGLKEIITKQPQIVLCDIIMPGLSGYELCKLIKEDPNSAHIPVILCSGIEREINRYSPKGSSAQGLILKKNLKKELFPTITKALKEAPKKKTITSSSKNSTTDIYQKLTRMLEKLLEETNIVNRFRQITFSTENEVDLAKEVLHFVNQLLDVNLSAFSIPLIRDEVSFGSFSFPIFRGEIDYIGVNENERGPEAITFLEQLNRNYPCEKIFIGDIQSNETTADSCQQEAVFIDLKAKEKICGRLTLLLNQHIDEKVTRLIKIIKTELGFVTDSVVRTARLKAMRADLYSAHEQTEQSLNSISSVLIELNPELQVTRWNHAANDLFGISSIEALGHSFSDVPITWPSQSLVDLIHACKDSLQPMRIEEISFSDKDENTHYASLTVTSLRSRLDKKHIGYILVGTDLTQKKALQSQLQQARKLEGIGQLSAGVAHEINTPIQYIGSNLTFISDSWIEISMPINNILDLKKKWAKNGNLNKQEVDELMSQIDSEKLSYFKDEIPLTLSQCQEGLDRVASIVRSMKEFAHPSRTKKVAVDLNHAIETTITVSRNEWRYVANLVTDFQVSLPPVPCRQDQLNQAILNLIINAAQAIEEKERPNSDKGTITIKTHQVGDEVEIRISDTGVGIPEKNVKRIFELFFTTKEVGKGTGQGLAIAHSIVTKEHQGKLWLESKEGIGTTFFIRIPLP